MCPTDRDVCSATNEVAECGTRSRHGVYRPTDILTMYVAVQSHPDPGMYSLAGMRPTSRLNPVANVYEFRFEAIGGTAVLRGADSARKVEALRLNAFVIATEAGAATGSGGVGRPGTSLSSKRRQSDNAIYSIDQTGWSASCTLPHRVS